MLTRVLLHVVVATLPVDLAVHRVAEACAGQRRGEHVRNALVLIDDVGDLCAAQRAQVERLAA